MTDLNAPLGPSRAAKVDEDARSGTKPASSSKTKFAIGLAAVSVLAANTLVFVPSGHSLSNTIVTLPEPVVTAGVGINGSQTNTENAQPQVQIVYGSPDAVTPPADNQAVAAPTGPVERPNQLVDEQRLSPGGPKLITIRDPAIVGIGQPLEVAHLPETAALEETPLGVLPKRSMDGRAPMDIYARPWSGAGGKRIALIIGGIGLSQTGTQRALDQLPPEITLGFSPEGNSLNRWMRAARGKGHELVLQIPMEPFGYPDINPGPQTLRLASSAQTNIEQLHQSMSKLTNYTGIMNYLGGRLATEPSAMRPIMGELSLRGLLFVNDGTVTAALGDLARDTGVAYAQADIVIDTSRTSEDIQAQLKALESLANTRGYAVGTGSALGLTVETVTDWANEAKKRGIEFVGISAIAREFR